MEDAMSRGSGGLPSSRRLLLVLAALLIVAGLLSAGPAAAHTFTRTDGNDSPSKLDLQSVSVSHTSTGVVHKFKTFASWTPRSLGDDSFFVVGINRDDDPAYERCAFIFFHNVLRGSLSNCGNTFIRSLPVSKPSGTVARVTIPTSETWDLYRWYGASVWDGPAPCGQGCVDFVPNRLPDILHDMERPHVVIDAFPDLLTESYATTAIPIGFTATDAGGSGIKTWKIQSSPPGSLPYTTRAQGTGGGSRVENAVFPEAGATYDVRVVVTDRQGNVDASATRRLIVPTDDASASMEYAGSWVEDAADPEYFLSTHHTGDEGDSVTFTVTGENISIISGPGSGTVLMTIISVHGTSEHLILLGSSGVPKRDVIYHLDFGDDVSREITLEVQAGSTFVFDGVASLEI
jgi:hypothetical protein